MFNCPDEPIAAARDGLHVTGRAGGIAQGMAKVGDDLGNFASGGLDALIGAETK